MSCNVMLMEFEKETEGERGREGQREGGRERRTMSARWSSLTSGHFSLEEREL